MNNVSALNNRLAIASKKFTKACEQIKLLKQQLAVYIQMLSNYTDVQHVVELSPNYLSRSEQKELDRTKASDINVNLSKEMLRQKIETLQDFKNIVFMYAHQKADEITKIQCELYGEDAVRNAYDNTSESQEYVPEYDEQTDTNNNDNDNNYDNSVDNNVDDDEDDDGDDNRTDIRIQEASWDNNFWTNNEHETLTSNESFHRTTQLQLIEYDFLTA